MESINLQSLADNLQSVTGLIIQFVGVLLVTILSFFMTRSIRRTSLTYWTIGWIALSIALLSLVLTFRIGLWPGLSYSIYLLGEYVFALMLVAGCRNYSTGVRVSRRDMRLLGPAIIIALSLPQVFKDFNTFFIVHAEILAVLFSVAFYFLLPARRRGKPGPGLRVTMVALALLALDFAHYVPVFTYVKLLGFNGQFAYLKYTSVYDLIFEILLGFGTVMVVMEEVRQEVEEANRELIAARDRLEVLARQDPLTEALNRHAFYSLLEKKQGDATARTGGCAVVVDIDNLKPINDRLGHAAGDAAIREVARSIRSVIRADDLLFRWGGDEFLILLFKVSEVEARKRVDDLDTVLSEARLPGVTAPVPLIVSYGIAQFSTMSQIEQAIEKADSAMYARKQSRKLQERERVS
jgi:diguanylate cyclase (GGDEF)-like protein